MPGHSDRRGFHRLKTAYQVRCGVCGHSGQVVPGFTQNMSRSGFSFVAPESDATVGQHVTVEIRVPGYDDPLYFLGEVIWTRQTGGSVEVGCRFDWIGQSDGYRAKLQALLDDHAPVA